MRHLLSLFFALAVLTATAAAQVTGGEILGTVEDPSGGAIPGAAVAVLSFETNGSRRTATDAEGRFRVPQLAVGSYELHVEKSGFARFSQGPIILRLNQNADLRVKLRLAGGVDAVTVTSDAPLLNTNNAEVGANFDQKRISDLPLAADRNVMNLALSVAGVSQFETGQNLNTTNNTAPPFTVNGMRVRSNNFMIDGQDSNFVVSGLAQQINNPDIIAEVRLITNQFAPEYGRNAGSVVNIITRSGANDFHGSAFWFHNDNHLNARNNLQKAAGLATPFRIENHFGGTFGGPVRKKKTFFFGSLQRWTDRRLGAGSSIRGVPTSVGRDLLNSVAGDRPTVKILLQFLPAAQASIPGLAASVTEGGRTIPIPLGTLTGSSNIVFNDWQWSGRVDHRFNEKNNLGGRYLFNDQLSIGDGQVTPPGLTNYSPARQQAASVFLNSILSSKIFLELRVSYQRTTNLDSGQDAATTSIPSIEVNELGLRGLNAGPTRTALGLAGNFPRNVRYNSYQLQETAGVLRGSHSMKYGIDFRREDVVRINVAPYRGRLVYNTLQDLVDDVAQTANITSPLPGGSQLLHDRDYSYFFFLQDEWRVRRDLTLTYGVRYESPGNWADSLRQLNGGIVHAAGGDPRFVFSPVPARDNNNWAPRFGFNYRIGGEGGKSVLRGGYSRVYDHVFLTIVSDAVTAFPFAKADVLNTRTPNSLEVLRAAASTPVAGNIDLLARTVLAPDLRSSFAEQFALQLQRELHRDWALSVGYVGTKGTALFETVDDNPIVPGTGRRIDPSRGVLTGKCNCASSIYHSLQTSLEKRLSRNFSMAAHYTWSTFIDEQSDIINPTLTGEIGIAQSAFNRRADRGRSAFDRPRRLAVNGVFELPFYRAQQGARGKVLGGWQVSGFLTLQSGAPFSALDGSDPGGLVAPTGSTVRANVNTSLDLARMSVEQIYLAGGASLFSRATAANPLGNMGRNVLRSNGIRNLDLGIVKNTKISESRILQLRAELYDSSNTRNFGIPDGSISSPNFLNQWGTDGGNRRIVVALRYVF